MAHKHDENSMQPEEDVRDSSYALKTHHSFSGRTYRRSRSDISKIQRELKYGQYLSVPKGSREIFGSHDKARQLRLILSGVAFIVLILVAVLFIVL